VGQLNIFLTSFIIIVHHAAMRHATFRRFSVTDHGGRIMRNISRFSAVH
jgi:hypothetical protein